MPVTGWCRKRLRWSWDLRPGAPVPVVLAAALLGVTFWVLKRRGA